MTQGLEAVAWCVPLIPALLVARRAAPGMRWPWVCVAVGVAVIAADKLIDLQTHAYQAGQVVVRRIDPVHRLTGEHIHWRWLLLAGVPALGAVALAWAVRRSEAVTRAAVVALVGLALVLAYVGLRLIPPLKPGLYGPAGKAIEVVCWTLVLAGGLWGSRGPRDGE